MYSAIAKSANVYFYIIGGGFREQKGLGIERIKHYANAFGLGSRLGIDLPGEKEGFIPDPQTKHLIDAQNPIWRIGDTYNTSIGQGGVLVTPLQMASLTAAIANGGNLWQPYLRQAILNTQRKESEIRNPFLLRKIEIDPANFVIIQEGMRQTVTSGTAHLLNEVGVSVAAKTGTAQAGFGLPHAWVTAFAPIENPEIAIVVMVEHAGEGSTVAVPITKEILRWYFTRLSPARISSATSTSVY
ncbi:MAG: penicillin-binding protein 2 [Parcubacteria group bacterium Gr01-1014_66]|nr:MAG: penicillin-binding protein 2 [Parcubacteria group bacterium Gr01-1014_66]